MRLFISFSLSYIVLCFFTISFLGIISFILLNIFKFCFMESDIQSFLFVKMLKLPMKSDIFTRKEGDQSLVTLTTDTLYMVCENDVIVNVT